MTKSKKDWLLKPQLTARLRGKSEEEDPINGESVLSSLHDIAKWVVSKTTVDHNKKDKDRYYDGREMNRSWVNLSFPQVIGYTDNYDNWSSCNCMHSEADVV